MIFAPTELKVRARVNTLNVTWHPSPNHTAASGYKLSCREAEADASDNGEKAAQTHTIRLRKKARYHLLTGLGKLLTSPNKKKETDGSNEKYLIILLCVCVCQSLIGSMR